MKPCMSSLWGDFCAVLCCTQLRPTLCDPMAPLSVGFPRQEYWSGLPFPFPGDLSDPGVEPASPALQADSLPLYHQGRVFELDGIF